MYNNERGKNERTNTKIRSSSNNHSHNESTDSNNGAYDISNNEGYNENNNLSHDASAVFGFGQNDNMNRLADTKIGVANEDETSNKQSTDYDDNGFNGNNTQTQQSTTIIKKTSTIQPPTSDNIEKIGTAFTKTISNGALLFVCILLLIIIIFVKNYGMTKVPTKIDQISKDRLKSLDTIVMPNIDSYEKNVSSMIAKELNVTNKNNNDENLYEIVRRGDQVFKFAKDRPTPKQKKHAIRNDIHMLGLDTVTDGYQ